MVEMPSKAICQENFPHLPLVNGVTGQYKEYVVVSIPVLRTPAKQTDDHSGQ